MLTSAETSSHPNGIALQPQGLAARKRICEGLSVRAVGNIVHGAFTPVLPKHSKSFSLVDCVSVGLDRMQRNFEPMRSR